MALVISFGAASCMNEDWSDPTGETSPFGNSQLQETNVVSIKSLIDEYGAKQKDKVNDTVRIADGVQIKGIVTGNDMEGNLYNQVTIDDGTAGMIICVAQGGMFGQLAIGQEILVNVGGLYYGTYRTQPQIGTPYTNFEKNQTYPSRMNRNEWQSRFKVIGKADPTKVSPVVVEKASDLNIEAKAYALAGRLVTLKNVEFNEPGKTFAPESEGYTTGYGVTRYFKGFTAQKKQIGVRTSCYADFAAETVPSGKVNVTGILTCYKSSLTSSYGNTVQLVLRSSKDIEAVK